MTTLAAQIERLPVLGLGISAEFNSFRDGIDALAFQREHPELVQFLEYGADIDRGLDEQVRAWSRAGLPTTYHFLDVNLEELDDLDETWMSATAAAAREIGAAWLCGDGGLWHFGPRDRAQMTLLPPVLTRASAEEMAASIQRLRDHTGLAVVPENPPATLFVGDLHILDYYALVSELADCPLLLDCAHLAIYQQLHGHAPTTGLADFPLDRVVEVHVAGGTPRDTDGFAWIEDDHSPEPLDATWDIVHQVFAGARQLRAVVYECERNEAELVVPVFERLARLWRERGERG